MANLVTVFGPFSVMIVAMLFQTKILAAPNVGITHAKNDTMLEHSKIVGGGRADISSFRWHVAIIKGETLIGNGNIIKPEVVLTVAHCLAEQHIQHLEIRSGSNFYDMAGRVVAVIREKIHSDYVHCKGCYNYDIGLLFSANPAIALGIPADVIALWDTRTLFAPGDLATLSGWGATEDGGMPSSFLRSVALPIVSHEDCTAHIGHLATHYICAGYSAGGKDACQGDSGAGLVIEKKLVGISSFGYDCGKPNNPGAYTSIPVFRNWIRIEADI